MQIGDIYEVQALFQSQDSSTFYSSDIIIITNINPATALVEIQCSNPGYCKHLIDRRFLNSHCMCIGSNLQGIVQQAQQINSQIPHSYQGGQGQYQLPYPGNPLLPPSSPSLSPALSLNQLKQQGMQYMGMDLAYIGNKTPIEAPKKKCECGAHSIGVDHHSDWCQLHTKDIA